MLPTSIDQTLSLLEKQQYFADRETATVLYLALRMQRPLFLEGEPGVGKTALAQAMARAWHAAAAPAML
jgi:MoxR-like ATPase